MERNIRAIAFYLPQYHPIPENDMWWGKGFTEWTNVAKSKPLFKGHHQPNFPGELGFYDLRISEVREQQAAIAKEHGVEGFMYWHYWFSGKRLMERPFQEVLESGKPDFPFCLAWANESWRGIWHNASNKTLIEQKYPGVSDYEKHFYAVLPAFQDKRYITVDGKPVFFIYNPFQIPDCSVFLETWRTLAKKNGLSGIHFIGQSEDTDISYDALMDFGFDAVFFQRLWKSVNQVIADDYLHRLKRKLKKIGLYQKYTSLGVIEYQDVIKHLVSQTDSKENVYPMLLPNWDNSPRTRENSLIIKDSTPELFRQYVKDVLAVVRDKPAEYRIVLIKSWNEWAEGNYLEPDTKYGRKYLEILKAEINCFLP
jgi:hypothetical protein